MSPALRGRGLTKILANFGCKLKPIIKTFARNLTPLAKEKIKTVGSRLIKKGGEILSKGAGRKKKRRGGMMNEAEVEEQEQEEEDIKGLPRMSGLIPSLPVKFDNFKKTKRKKKYIYIYIYVYHATTTTV